MVDEDQVESIQFSWGKKRGVGLKKKEIQFYESFTYDGVPYTLYDSVYLYVESEKEPYVGKLIKLWETSDKTKKVKVLWFFRPHEISNYLGSEEIPDNELFLASGDGVGLSNVNPLEAIAGKCNVVCTSKDSRNVQPSEEELQMADFIFYRTFDVGKYMILDKFDEKIAGVAVKFLLNRVDRQKPGALLKLELDKEGVSGNSVASDDTVDLSEKENLGEFVNVKIGCSSIHTLARENADSEGLLANKKSLLGEKPVSHVVEETAELAKTDAEKGNACGNRPESRINFEENTGQGTFFIKQSSSIRERPASDASVQSGEVVKADALQENAVIDSTVSRSKIIEIANPKTLLGDKESLPSEKSAYSLEIGSAELQQRHKKELRDRSNIQVSQSTPDDSLRSKIHKVNQVHTEERAKVVKDSDKLDNRPSKRPKLDGSVKALNERINKRMQNHSPDLSGSDANVSVRKPRASETQSKSKLGKDLQQTRDSVPMKAKQDERLAKLPNSKSELSHKQSVSNEGSTFREQPNFVSRKPEADKSRWFKRPPWEQQIQAAHERGTLVLLQNLDPSCTSAEVEDIVWHAFKESCTAKMIQQTAFSTPHFGQAFIIFRTREAAEKAVRMLDDGCFLLSNERPLVGSFAPPCVPKKQTSYVGHLVIDRLRLQLQRKEAVSTSHCSQPNTLAYDMALEWRLLQERSYQTWKKLHKQQGQELSALKAVLKSK